MLFCVYIEWFFDLIFEFFFLITSIMEVSFSGWMYIKGVPFPMESIRKRYLFCQKYYIKW